MRSWRNWQTRMVQVHVEAIRWRFKSSWAHHYKPLYIKGLLLFVKIIISRIIGRRINFTMRLLMIFILQMLYRLSLRFHRKNPDVF